VCHAAAEDEDEEPRVLSDAQRREAAAALFGAEMDESPIDPITVTYPYADIEDAYRIGEYVTELKEAAGIRVKGHKVGLTSKAMRELTGATEPDYGTIFDRWFVPEGSVVAKSRMNRPAVEIELAFVLRTELGGPGVNAADVIRATDFVLPAIEIVDSRYNKRGTLVDSIADAAACGLIVLGGNPARLEDIDVRRIGASLSVNGEIEQSGVARAVLGNPINAVAWLANKLSEFGVTMQPGHVILSGSFIRAIPFHEGDTLAAIFDELGEVTLSLE
jgi:2-keto-4-pentenoate hydratase